MREIKFRAWDKVTKQIGEVVSIDLQPLDIRIALFDPVKGERYIVSRAGAPLMQYTGLKDKNGKEIYEGDIVEATNKYNSTPTKRPAYEIIFEEGAFCGISIKRHTVKGKGLRTLKLRLDDTLEMETAEVIGNIYENPELRV